MSLRKRRHPPQSTEIVTVRRQGREVPVPDPKSPERTKDSAKSLNGPCLLNAPEESFDIVWKAFPSIFLSVIAQILAAGIGLKYKLGPQEGLLGVRQSVDRKVFRGLSVGL